MSAGICIMNKKAIALAADSAVTVGDHLAIHNSAKKLFALSKVAPVGVIIYSSAELMNVPVEIMFQQYKAKLSKTTYATLNEYVEDFLNFLLENQTLFHFDANEKGFVSRVYVDLLNGFNGDYQRLIKNKIEEVQRELTEEELKKLQEEVVTATTKYIAGLPQLANFDVLEYIRANYEKEIAGYIKGRFTWVSDDQLARLSLAVCSIYNKHFFRSGYVGLAFAGYGETEIFPRMIHMHISGIVDNKIRRFKKETIEITEAQTATITPLAQTDVMQTFLFGINDSFIHALEREIPLHIEKNLQKMDDSLFASGKKSEVQMALNSTTADIIKRIVEKAQVQYLRPITQSVASLPIEELSLLAESMINITSLRRKVAIDDNIGTVGGPIDVAIISKSDGFIWLKRKHYFDGAYNPQYFFSHYLSNGEMTNGNT